MAAAVASSSPTRVVFVLGGPGSGKGTNCERIVNEFGFAHLSAGDLLRAERKSGSKLGEEIENLIKQGILVSSEITVRLLKEAMEKSSSNKFLIDGFPRNAENYETWNRDMSDCIVDFVLVLECPDEVSLSPPDMQNTHNQHNTIIPIRKYIFLIFPFCFFLQVMQDRLLGRGQGRSDDNVTAIQNRLNVYHDLTQPIIEIYKAQGQAKFVDSAGDIDDVYANVRSLFTEAQKLSDSREEAATSSSEAPEKKSKIDE
jgi:UMP-CMP kinase